jgi:hypothetical protein
VENTTFIEVRLFDVRVIVAIILVFVVELLYQAVTGWVPVLECVLPYACGHERLHSVLSGIKWPRFPRISTLGPLSQYWEPLGVATVGPSAC